MVSGLEGLEGVDNIVYHPENDTFMVSYLPGVVSLEVIFDTIRVLGVQTAREYEPALMENAA